MAKKNSVRTSSALASKAGKVLSSPSSSKLERSLAGSVVSNRRKTNKK